MGGTASRPDEYVSHQPTDADGPDSRPDTPPGLVADDRKGSSLANITPTEFKWSFGGHSVYVTGAWDDWRVKAALSHSTPTDFTTVLALPLGTYQYKFIVDGNWKHSPAYATERDQHGNLNNIITVVPQMPEYDLNEPLNTDELSRSPMDSYDYSMLPQEDHTTEPPTLPRLLASAPLDKRPSSSASGTDFVRLNHMFGTNSDAAYGSSDIRTMASELRYNSKVVTTILVTTKSKSRPHIGLPGQAYDATPAQRVLIGQPPLHQFGESESLILDALNNV